MTDTAAIAYRPATPADLDAVSALLSASALPLDGVPEVLPSAVVAEAGGAVIGVAGLELCDRNALLRSVAVSDAWRSHGLGRELVTRVLAAADARGLDGVYLLTTTAERYFPAFGFVTVDRSVVPDDIRATGEFREACPASATVMARRATVG